MSIQINFAEEEELRELPGVGSRVAKNILRFRQDNFPITPSNIYDIPRLKTSKKFLQLIDFTAVHKGSGEPIHVDVRSRTNYHPQESFVQTLSQYIDDNQPKKNV